MQAIQKHSNEQQGMSETSRKVLGWCLATAAEVYRTEVTKPTVAMWAEQLKSYSPGEIKAAFMQHMGESEFFPTPAGIIKLIPFDETRGPAYREYVPPTPEYKCVDCQDTGYRIVIEERRVNGLKREVESAKPCACRKKVTA